MHIYTHALCTQHEVPHGHPERPERLQSSLTHLHDCGISQDHPLSEAPAVQQADVLRAHPASHIDMLEATAPRNDDDLAPLDPDTWMGPHSLAAASVAAGAVCAGVDDLLEGRAKRVFCAVRPPGHHAEADAAMGFCLYNSVAIGALHALNSDAVQRVAVLDFDVHHGNGTVDIFKNRPEVLVCSSFQHPHYPNRLFDLERDNIVNTPMAAGTGGDTFRQLVERDWLPALAAHKPELILVSAGFDAHQLDPLAQINLVEADFAWITDLIVDAANQYANGRVLSTLEGGYDLDALARSVEAHLGQLIGGSAL